MIEAGEYVRTKEGYIGELIEINKKNWNYLTVNTKNDMKRHDIYPRTYLYLKNENIKKHSKNIIDLIEVGDYVNGHLVTDKYIDTDDIGNDFIAIEVESDMMIHKSLLEKHIKEILTHEQYEANCYRLEK